MSILKSMLFIFLRVVDCQAICCKNSQEPNALYRYLFIRRDKLMSMSAAQALDY